MSQAKDNINNGFVAFRKAMLRAVGDLPLVVGTTAVKYAQRSFDQQGFEGKPWQKRKQSKTRRNTKPILQQSGALRKSFQILSQTATTVTVGSVLPYAQIHNEGGIINRAARSETFQRNRHTKGNKKGKFKRGTIAHKRGFTFKAYAINMPKRTFFQLSPNFEKEKDEAISKHLEDTLKQF